MKKKILILVVVIGGVYALYRLLAGGEEALGFEYVAAQKQNIIQEVSVIGRVEPLRSVELALERSGRVSGVYVDVGDRVNAGDVLLRLASSDLAAELDRAEANVDVEKAALDELLRGARAEDISISEVKVQNARVALNDAKIVLMDKLKDAYTKADDAIRNKIDHLYDNPRTANPTLDFTVNDYKLKIKLEEARADIERLLISWRSDTDALSLENDLFAYVENVQSNLDVVKRFLEDMALAVNAVTAGPSLTQSTIDGWRSDVSLSRTNISIAVTNIIVAEEKVTTANSALNLADNELILKKAGATEDQIRSQEARIRSAEANVRNVETQIAKTVLYAPISGVVTENNISRGEIASMNVPVVTLISDGQFQIEANVPEADIAKVKIGDTAKVELDAYGSDEQFSGAVTSIDPAERLIEGVATYNVTLAIADPEGRVRSGMTADIDILTAAKDDVVVVPGRAIYEKDGVKTLRIYDGVSVKEVPVVIGLRGSSGNVEILEGVSEGDKVIIYMESNI